MKKFILAFGLLLSCLSFGIKLSVAQSINYAGFSYLGDADLISSNYPISSNLNKIVDGRSSFDVELLSRINNFSPNNFSLNVTELADLNKESQLSMTFALESETTSVERIGSDYKLLIQLSAQILLFDYREMTIVASYPIAVEYIDTLDKSPDNTVIKQRYNELFYGDSAINVFSLFKDKLDEINPQIKYANRVQVTNVSISDSASKIFPKNYSDKQKAQLIGQSFTSFLSTNQNISILPYTKGHAIGNKLAGRFASGEAYMLLVPEPDYSIDVGLLNLKKKLFDEKPSGKSWIYAARSNFKVYESLSNDVFFTENLFNGATKLVPSTQANNEEWPAYRETLLMLFDKFTKAISNPNKKWLKKHAGNSKKFTEFKKLKEVIDSCR